MNAVFGTSRARRHNIKTKSRGLCQIKRLGNILANRCLARKADTGSGASNGGGSSNTNSSSRGRWRA